MSQALLPTATLGTANMLAGLAPTEVRTAGSVPVEGAAGLLPVSNFAEMVKQQAQLAREGEANLAGSVSPESGNLLPPETELASDPALLSTDSGSLELAELESIEDVALARVQLLEDVSEQQVRDEQALEEVLMQQNQQDRVAQHAQNSASILNVDSNHQSASSPAMSGIEGLTQDTPANSQDGFRSANNAASDSEQSFAVSVDRRDQAAAPVGQSVDVDGLLATASQSNTSTTGQVKHFDVLSPLGMPLMTGQAQDAGKADTSNHGESTVGLTDISRVTQPSSTPVLSVSLAAEGLDGANEFTSQVNSSLMSQLRSDFHEQKRSSATSGVLNFAGLDETAVDSVDDVVSGILKRIEALPQFSVLGANALGQGVADNLSALVGSFSNLSTTGGVAQLQEMLSRVAGAISKGDSAILSDITQAVESALSGVADGDVGDMLESLTRNQQPLQLTMAGKGTMGTPSWSQAFTEKMAVLSSVPGNHTVELQLDPPELGALRVKIQVTQDQQVNITFTSPHGGVRETIEEQLPRLREMLEAQGLDLADASFTDGSDGQPGEQSGQQFAGQGQSDEDAEFVDVRIPQGLVDDYA